MKKLHVLVLAIVVASGLAFQSCSPGRCKDCGKVVRVTVLRGVHFDFNKSEIKPSGIPILNEDVKLLNKDPSLDITIGGHCDIVGSDAYNQKLSERRAQAVYNYFLRQGIWTDRMRTIGYGRSRPVVPNDTEANRAMNRRVEIKIIKARAS